MSLLVHLLLWKKYKYKKILITNNFFNWYRWYPPEKFVRILLLTRQFTKFNTYAFEISESKILLVWKMNTNFESRIIYCTTNNNIWIVKNINPNSRIIGYKKILDKFHHSAKTGKNFILQNWGTWILVLICVFFISGKKLPPTSVLI